MKTRVLIIDDSPFIRRMLSDWLKDASDFEVAGVATNGEEGVRMVQELKPDIVTLDVEMPVMDGLTALAKIMAVGPVPVLMVSSVTTQGAEQTIKALELGAVDFVTKPDGGAGFKFVRSKDELLDKLRGVRSARVGGRCGPSHTARPTSVRQTDKTVLIASSTGGPKALATLFAGMPKGFPAPVLIVQHMPAGFTASFARRLEQIGAMPVHEASDGETVKAGIALVAPGGRHMSVTSEGRVKLTDEAPQHGVRPAADVLFKSGAKLYKDQAIGVVLTGMGRDGAAGALALREAGGTVLGECESSCVVYGMPKAAKEIGAVDAEFPIDEMAQAIVASLNGRARRAS
ncbi:MAG: chemotaxis response regulator protein-glutamate methylesterase [Armatimonadetes bacterium]|nr:chemotaxis response regulator protein-glutamate methylesterase [Armatimonadota bacterium]